MDGNKDMACMHIPYAHPFAHSLITIVYDRHIRDEWSGHISAKYGIQMRPVAIYTGVILEIVFSPY